MLGHMMGMSVMFPISSTLLKRDLTGYTGENTMASSPLTQGSARYHATGRRQADHVGHNIDSNILHDGAEQKVDSIQIGGHHGSDP
jgi:hypothetical protein